MTTEQKLVRNGSATQITVPKQMLMFLNWLPGDRVVIEMLEDRSIRIRERDIRDLKPRRAPRLFAEGPGLAPASTARVVSDDAMMHVAETLVAAK